MSDQGREAFERTMIDEGRSEQLGRTLSIPIYAVNETTATV